MRTPRSLDIDLRLAEGTLLGRGIGSFLLFLIEFIDGLDEREDYKCNEQEVDHRQLEEGGQPQGHEEEQQAEDAIRTDWLEHQGYKVVRFTNEQVLCDTDNMINELKKRLDPSNSPV